jgi:2-polyprenyl-6-methoxyphenol hydroxylase-like FAD-dependent oxidoreductase
MEWGDIMSNKVLIVGAGISGLACALMLEKIGYQPVIFEKSDSLRNEGGGLTLWSNATDALDCMGLLDEVYQHSKILTESALLTSTGKTLSMIPLKNLATIYGTHTVAILRATLHHLLVSQLQHTQIKLGYKLIGVKETNEEVIASFENGHEETGVLLIGADGIHSKVRNLLFPHVELRFSGYEAWRGIASIEHPFSNNGYSFEAWGNGLRFGFVPVSNSTVYWFATRNISKNLMREEITKAELAHVFSEFVEPISSVIQATNEKDISRKVIYDFKPLQKWSKGRVLLIGDAAHATTPNLGQGACMALEDAVVLASTFKSGNTISNAVKTFEEKRIGRAKFIVHSSWMMGKIAQMENKLLCNLRNRLVRQGGSAIERNKNFDRIIGYKSKSYLK